MRSVPGEKVSADEDELKKYLKMELKEEKTVEKINEIFVLAAELAIKDGAVPIEEMYVRKINDSFTIVINSDKEREYKGMKIPPFHMYVEYNGLPAGLLDPWDGFIASGKMVNENALIKALKTALEEIE